MLCQSAAAGDLSFPVTALSEIVFQPRGEPPPGGKNASDAKDNPAINGIWQRQEWSDNRIRIFL